MITQSHDNQIRNSVVESISVDVMDDLKTVELTSQLLFHNLPMFVAQFPVDLMRAVPIPNGTLPLFSYLQKERVAVLFPSDVMLLAPPLTDGSTTTTID